MFGGSFIYRYTTLIRFRLVVEASIAATIDPFLECVVYASFIHWRQMDVFGPSQRLCEMGNARHVKLNPRSKCGSSLTFRIEIVAKTVQEVVSKPRMKR